MSQTASMTFIHTCHFVSARHCQGFWIQDELLTRTCDFKVNLGNGRRSMTKVLTHRTAVLRWAQSFQPVVSERCDKARDLHDSYMCMYPCKYVCKCILTEMQRARESERERERDREREREEREREVLFINMYATYE